MPPHSPHSRLFSVSLRACVLLLLILGATPAAAPVSAAPTLSNACFIPHLYHDLLARTPAPSEISTGLAFLGSHTREEFASTLLTGAEYRADLVQAWYQQYLGRLAADAEVAVWQTAFGSGETDEQIVASLTGSDEYFNLARVGATNPGFVQALYPDLLGRAPSPTELSTWVSAITGGTTRTQVAQAILSSSEYRSDIIQAWYQRYLHHPALASDVNFWQSFLQSGGTDEQVVATLTGSQEYFTQAGLCTVFLPLVKR